MNANDSKAIIRESYQEMTNGDRITAKRTLPPLPSNKAPEEKDIGGYIVASRSASSVMQVKNMIVYLDAGSEQKVAPGDLFEVYVVPEMENKKALSPRVLGELLVVDTQDNTSTAVILKSNVELSIGQKVRYKK
ncbi:MAG: hypothetical protein A3K09_08330 [Nitrospinae bacterium RIFCSPLOWO2_12_FULL_47_7]|nr:MAG: hypothetical protein A3K09_08330 [Nitrospinae bacterium RIFCSPLOWO2_12_FULL_47_7]